MKKYLLILFLITLIIPSVTYASWWNPFSWFTNRAIEKPTVIVPAPVVAPPKPIDTAVVIPPTPKKANTLKKKAETKNNSKTNVVPLTSTDKPTDIKESTSTASGPSNSPIPLHYTNPIPAPIVNAPRTALINEFLKNPTLENFKVFCSSAKNVTGNSTKQVLDSNRENLITIKLNVYDDMKDCQNLDDADSRISYLTLDNTLLFTLQDNESDEIRTAKLAYNNIVNNLITTSRVKFVSFRKPGCAKSQKCSTLTELFQTYIDNINVDQNYVNSLNLANDPSKTRILTNANSQLKRDKTSLNSIGSLLKDISANFK